MSTFRKTIFLVDDNLTNLTIGKNALIGKYNVFTAPSGVKLLEMLDKISPQLILLDIEMPAMNGYEVIKKLKENESTASIPVIFLTAKSDSDSELEGLLLGAVDYIYKPFSPPLLQRRVENVLKSEEQKYELQNYNDNLQDMVLQKTKSVVELQSAILKTMAELVEYRDNVTGGHIERTQEYLKILINDMKRINLHIDEIEDWDIELILLSSQLHDVGKIAVRDSILQKPGKLSIDEFEEMKSHTLFGLSIIEKVERNTSEITFLEYAKIFAVTHHEKWDGTGYPRALKGGSIPLIGRLMAIVDVYDALISARPYKKPFTHEQAVEIMKEGSGTHFDPELIEVFLSCEGEFAKVASGVYQPYLEMIRDQLPNP